MRILVLCVVVLAACGDSLPPRVDAAVEVPIDAAAPAVPIVRTFEPYPDVVVDGCTGVADVPFLGLPTPVDDCVECTCTSWGGRCARRPSCARDVCVLVDGTTIARGETAVVGCFDCTCGAAGPTCTRRTAAPCPADACALPRGGTVPVGAKRFVSECHVCTCDAERGLSCDDLCHPSCYCEAEGPVGCRAECGDPPCDVTVPPQGLEIPDQASAILGCAVCVCDYGELACDASACP